MITLIRVRKEGVGQVRQSEKKGQVEHLLRPGLARSRNDYSKEGFALFRSFFDSAAANFGTRLIDIDGRRSRFTGEACWTRSPSCHG